MVQPDWTRYVVLIVDLEFKVGTCITLYERLQQVEKNMSKVDLFWRHRSSDLRLFSKLYLYEDEATITTLLNVGGGGEKGK